MRKILTVIVMASCCLAGCATKRYGRVEPLTGMERAAYSCRDIALEMAKVQAFQTQVAQGAQFNAASVLGILGDFGIGNSMERHEAEASAAQRLQQLNDLSAERGCTGYTLNASDQRAAAMSVANSPSATLSTDPLDPPGTIDLGGGVKLRPAKTLSGYCIAAPGNYMGTGASNRPAITSARPVCGS